jgi:hypothetical protein
VVLTVLPLALLAAVMVPELRTSLVLPAAFASVFVAAVYALLTRVARARGREREIDLYRAWGGKPTTAMLRHRDNRLNQHTKERYHDRLRALGPPYRIPTAAEEEADPAAADARYESAMDEVRRRAKVANISSVHREKHLVWLREKPPWAQAAWYRGIATLPGVARLGGMGPG